MKLSMDTSFGLALTTLRNVRNSMEVQECTVVLGYWSIRLHVLGVHHFFSWHSTEVFLEPTS